MGCSLSCAYKLRVSEQGVNGLCSGIAGPRDRAAATVGVGPRLTHGQPRRLHQERVRARRFHVRCGVVGGPCGLASRLARGPRQLVDRGLLADTAAFSDAQRLLAGALHVTSGGRRAAIRSASDASMRERSPPGSEPSYASRDNERNSLTSSCVKPPPLLNTMQLWTTWASLSVIPPSGCGSRRTLTAPMSSCRRAVHDTRPSAPP